MARRKTRTTTTKIVRVPARQSAPIIKVSAPRAAPAKRRTRRRSGGRSVGGMIAGSRFNEAIGGALYGFAVKSGWVDRLPAIPIVGRTGTAAILLDYFAKRGGGEMVKRAATAAAVIAGYQLGSTGTITGEHFATAGNADDVDASYADDDDYED